MKPGGPGELEDCLKCIECGWSLKLINWFEEDEDSNHGV